MKRLILGIVLFVCVNCVVAEAKIRVVTTTTDLAALVKAVGGDEVVVESIAKGYQDPHYVQAKPSYMRLMNRADLLVYVGLELEVGWLPLLVQGARNPKIASGEIGHLDASVGIVRLGVPEGQIDRSMGDVHPEGNPHYWLDPHNGLVVAKAIAERLSVIAPDKSDVFWKHLGVFDADLKARIAHWEKHLVHFKGKKVVTYHQTWDYLANWLQFEIMAQVENKPGIPPSPRHVSDLVSRMKSEKIDVILCANLVDEKTAKRVAQKADAKLVVLPTSVAGAEGIETYVGLFDHIVSRLLSLNEGS